MASRTSRAVYPPQESPERSGSDQTFASEHNSDADLAERHAAAVSSAAARPMGLLERQDSAHYQPRPPAMTERQDSAQNLQAMAEEMAELTATGSPTAEGPVSRQDSAHDMAQEPRSQGLQQQLSSRLSEGHNVRDASLLSEAAIRSDSASEGTARLPATGRAPESEGSLGRDASSGARLLGAQSARYLRDSASEGLPGMQASFAADGTAAAVPGFLRDRASEGGAVPSARAAASQMGNSAFARAPSLRLRDSADEERGEVEGGRRGLPTTRQVSSASERAPSTRGLNYLRDSANEESAAMLAHSGRRDSASEQALRDSASEAGPSRPLEAPQASSMRSAPSLEVARALMLDDPALSPRTAMQQMAWSPRDEPLSRQDSALDSLVAARHAVLADLAQSARPDTPVEANSASVLGSLPPRLDSRQSSSRAEQPILDPLMQARALVQSHFASSSSVPTPLPTSPLLDSLKSAPSLEAARLAVLGPSYSSGTLRPSSANIGVRHSSQEFRSGRRWQSYGGDRGETLGLELSQPSPSDKGKAVVQSCFASGSGDASGRQGVNGLLQNSSSGVLWQALEADPSAAGPSSSGQDDYVSFMGRVSLEDPRQLSSADAAQRAALLDGFRQTLQGSLPQTAAGDGERSAQVNPEASGSGGAALQGFGSARRAESGLPDTPLGATGSNHAARLSGQRWRTADALSDSPAAQTSRRLSSGYDSAHEH